MLEEVFLRNLGIIIVAASATALLAHWLKVPAIVAYLLAGLAIGPIAGVVHLEESIDLISELGIVLLLFLVGLELNFAKIRAVASVAAVVATGQGILTTIAGYAVATLLGFATVEAVFIGVLLSFSSTVIAVKLLGERNELATLHGRIAVGVLLVQDLMVIVILTFMSAMESSADLSFASLTGGLLRAFGGMALLVGVTLAASRFVLPRLFDWAASAPDTAFIWSLTWCFVVVVGAESLHLSIEIGAFLAGVALAQLPHNHDLHRRVNPLMNFFLAVFFVSLGVRMQISPTEVSWLAAILLSLFVLALKPLAFMILNARMGYAARPVFHASLTMAQISEFSVILATAGVAAGLLPQATLSLIGLVALITMAVSAALIKQKERLLQWSLRRGLLRPLRIRDGIDDVPGEARTGHVIVVGVNSLGLEIVTRLLDRGESVLAIDTDPGKLRGLACDTLQGGVEYLSTLLDAGLPHAKLLVSALQIEEANDLLAHRCRAYGVPCAIHALDLSVIDNLFAANVTYLMLPKVDGIKLQTRELKRMGYIK